MKIAIDISQIVHEGTGVATYTDQLVRNLLKIDKTNEYILFGISLRKQNTLTNFYSELKANHRNVSAKFFRIPPTCGEFIWNKIHLLNLDNFIGKVDIFHSSDWIQPPISAVKATTVHDLLVYDYPDVSHPAIINTQKRRLQWVKKECDLIFADSEFTKNRLIKVLDIDKSVINVVYPGISAKFKPETTDKIDFIKQKYGLYDDYILTVGTQEPRKNIGAAVLAFERFQKHPLIATNNKPISLVIVGKYGWGEKVVNAKYIKILGFVEESDLPAIYSGAKFLVYPSLYEGFGFPILEAMACRCPVITSPRGSLKELSADAAIIVDPEDIEDISLKMVQLSVDENLKTELIKKGSKTIEKFNWEETVKNVLTLYNKTVNQNI